MKARCFALWCQKLAGFKPFGCQTQLPFCQAKECPPTCFQVTLAKGFWTPPPQKGKPVGRLYHTGNLSLLDTKNILPIPTPTKKVCMPPRWTFPAICCPPLIYQAGDTCHHSSIYRSNNFFFFSLIPHMPKRAGLGSRCRARV